MFAYSSRTDILICTKLDILISRDHEEISERSKHRKSVLSSSPSEDCSVARKLNTIEERCQDQSYLFRRRDYRSKGNNPKCVLVLSPGEDVGFRDNFFL
jgi:hypothetical protein